MLLVRECQAAKLTAQFVRKQISYAEYKEGMRLESERIDRETQEAAARRVKEKLTGIA